MLSNIKDLRDDMVKKDWTICSFLFKYKQIEYVVLVKRFVQNIRKKNKFALVQLHFFQSNNLQNDFCIEASSYQLLVGAKILREYFGIEYSENLGDVIEQFTQRLDKYIPTEVPNEITDMEKGVMVQDLGRNDSDDPEKIYCNSVKRNPNNEVRSVFNSDKTRLLRPSLFEYFKEDRHISFCYFKDIDRERSDEDILRSFAQRNK